VLAPAAEAAAHTRTAAVKSAAIEAPMRDMEIRSAISEEDVVLEKDAVFKNDSIPEEDGTAKTMPKKEMIVGRKDGAAGEKRKPVEGPWI
jgi:hypothetical protein